MAGSGEARELDERKIHIEVVFDATKYGVNIPDGALVLVQNTATGWGQFDRAPVMDQDGDVFSFRGEIPVDAGVAQMQYRFYVVSPNGNFAVPESGENLMMQFGAPQQTAPSMEAPVSAGVTADVANVDVGVAGKDVDLLRGDTERLLRGVFTQPTTETGRPERTQAREMAESVVDFATRLRERAEGSPEVLRYVQDHFGEDVNAVHKEWIRTGSEAPKESHALLETAEGRLKFRVLVFNGLCNQLPNLREADKVRKKLSAEDFEQYASKKLGRFLPLYKRICSRYDGGSIRETLDGARDEILGNIPEHATAPFQRRIKARAILAQSIANRVGEGMGDTYAASIEYGKMTAFLREGGDVAIKSAALAMLLSHPVIAGGLFLSRSITESMGYDFGEVLRRSASLAKEGPKRLFKGALKLLPEEWLQKLPRKTQDWLEKPHTALFQKVNRASLPTGAWWKIFAKDLIPASEVARFIPKWGKKLPEMPLPGKLAEEQALADESTIESACVSALASLAPAHTGATASAASRARAA